MPAKKQISERKAKPSGQVVGRSLDPVVGFWIEMVPIERKVTKEKLETHINSIRRADWSKSQLELVMEMMSGIADNRGASVFTSRKSLPIFETRKQAKSFAKTVENEFWTARVRIARKANATAERAAHPEDIR